MKYAFTLFFLLISFLLKGQNLHISTGFYINSMSLSAWDSRPPEHLNDFKNSYIHVDYINILFEKEMNDFLSLKSGFYLNLETFDFFGYYPDIWMGKTTWILGEYYEKVQYFEIPLLLTFQIADKNKKLNLHINAGPYIGTSALSKFPPHYLTHFDFGINISLGVGVEKWQFNCYLMKGLRNIAVFNNFEPLEKAKATFIGFNLTRVISLKRKTVAE
jgi:hypothetical protein